MNERIKQLWDQAAKLETDPSWEGQTKFMEKFAELIVKECMHLCDVVEWGCITHDLDKQAQGCRSAQQYIAEHFGVEE
jgi:hypothetical protein